MNSHTFTFKDQDDTLGNLLQHALLDQESVYFAAYKQEHPLDRTITVRVQTADTTTPEDALAKAFADLREQTRELQKAWDKAVKMLD